MSAGQTQLGKFQMPQVGDTLEGRYRIDSVLATGGMGVILRAQHMRMGREVAVKILHPHIAQNQEVLARFEREVRLAQRLNHPNTIRLYDFGEAENGLIYVVMELLDGADLKEIIEREQTLSLGRAVDLTLQVLDGLGEAHEQDFVHRDLKPSNIFVCTDRRGGDQVKILDFGIAKSLEETASEITKTGSICGTAAYVAPEYLHDPTPNKSADLYAVGLILLEMVTGKRVFHGMTTAQTLMMQMQREVQVPRALANSPLAEIITRATQKDPARRYGHADQMFQALEAVSGQIHAAKRLQRDQIGEVLRPVPAASPGAPGATGATGGQIPHNDSSSSLPQPDSTPPSGGFQPSSEASVDDPLLGAPVEGDISEQQTLITSQPSPFDSQQAVPAPQSASTRSGQGDSSGARLGWVALAVLLVAGGAFAFWSSSDSDEPQPGEPQKAAAAHEESTGLSAEDDGAPERDELAPEPASAAADAPQDEPAEDEALAEDEPAEDEALAEDEPAEDEAAEEDKPAEDEPVAEDEPAAARRAPEEQPAASEPDRPASKKQPAPERRSRESRQAPEEKPSSDDGEENVDEFLDEYL